MKTIIDKKEALKAVKKYGFAIEYVSNELKNDKEIVLEAVKENGLILGHISDELKNDREIVLEAVKRNGYALNYTSDEFKNDREVVLTAIEDGGFALRFTSDELKNDREVVLTAVKAAVKADVKGSGDTLEFASDELKNDKEFMLEVIKRDGNALKFASDELKNDREVVLTAIKDGGYALQFASNELKYDKKIILEAVKKNRDVLYILQINLFDDDITFLFDLFITVPVVYHTLKNKINEKSKKIIDSYVNKTNYLIEARLWYLYDNDLLDANIIENDRYNFHKLLSFFSEEQVVKCIVSLLHKDKNIYNLIYKKYLNYEEIYEVMLIDNASWIINVPKKVLKDKDYIEYLIDNVNPDIKNYL